MSKRYIQKIDFFRAVSILLVVLFHLDIKLFQGGFIGVDIFFVLSGFLITKIIKSELDETGGFSFANFYLKRARRLLPSLFLMFFLVFVFTYFIFSPSDFIKSTQSIFMAAIIISNIFFFKQSGYFDKSSELEPLLHTWSLGIEEQFYLLWPLALILIYKFFKSRMLFLTLILFGISFCGTFYFSSVQSIDGFKLLGSLDAIQLKSAIFYLLPFRIFEFLIGAICLFLLEKFQGVERNALLLNVLGLLMIFGSSILLHKEIYFLGVLNIIPCLGIALLLIIKVPSVIKPLYENKLIGLIGKASYTWYLFHWPMIAISKYVFERDLTSLESALIFGISLFISILVYKFYENPIRYGKSGQGFKRNKVFVISILLFVISTAFLSFHISSNNGWLFRLDSKQKKIALQFDTVEDFHTNYWGGAGYEIGYIGKAPNKNNKVDLVLIGESHCGHFAFGLDSILVKQHHKTIYLSNLMNPSAIYLPDVIPTHLNESRITKSLDRTIRILKKNPDATILISHFWAVQLSRSKAKLADGEIVKLSNTKRSFNILVEKINKLLELAGDRKVIIFGSGPIMPYSNKLNHIERVLKPNFNADEKYSNTMFTPNNSYYLINDFFSDYVKDKPNLYYFDPREPFCENGHCFAQKDEVLYLSDWDHLSKDGSLLIIQHFEDRIMNILNKKK